MDYLEITKNESLRKYEENVYLLGNIFSTGVRDEDIGMDGNSDESDCNDSDSEEDSIDKEIMQLFMNNPSNQSQAINEPPIDSDEKINQIYGKLKSNSYDNPEESVLLGQLKKAMDDYKEHGKILNNNKNNFTDSTKKFQEIYQKFRTIKPALVGNNCTAAMESNSHPYIELIQEVDDLGILPETFKQNDKTEKKTSLNCELPFDPTNNIVIMPL